MKKTLIWILITVFAVTSVISMTVQAQEIEVLEDQLGGMVDSQEKTDGITAVEIGTDNNEVAVGVSVEESNKETDLEKNTKNEDVVRFQSGAVISVSAADVLNYLYIDYSEFTEECWQNIVVSVGEDDEVLEDAVLILENEGEERVLEASCYEGNSALFLVDFSEDIEVSQIKTLRYVEEGCTYELSFTECSLDNVSTTAKVAVEGRTADIVAIDRAGNAVLQELDVTGISDNFELRGLKSVEEELNKNSECEASINKGSNADKDPLAFKWVIMGDTTIKTGEKAELYYAVNRDATVSVDIYYGDDRYLKSLVKNAQIKTNDQVAVWDMKDALGEYVENGTYRFTVTAVDGMGTKIIAHCWFDVKGNDPLAFKWAIMGTETVKVGEQAELYYAVNKNATVSVDIYYGDNRYLKSLVKNMQIGTNDQVAVWDLRNVAGAYVENGTYRYTITAVDKTGAKEVVHCWFNVTGNNPLAFKWAVMGTGTVKVGEKAELYYAVNKDATVSVDIYYGDNRYLKSLVKNMQIKTNDQVAVWDMKDTSGEYVENGTYRYTVTIMNEKGEKEVVHRWFNVTGNEPFGFKWTTLDNTRVAWGSSVSLFYATNRPATVTIRMYYGNNRYMKTLVSTKEVTTTDQVIEWDLKDVSGKTVTEGLYRFTITAVDGKGNTVVAHKYFNVTDELGDYYRVTQYPSITGFQSMCYTIEDRFGRLIIIDGGYEQDSEQLRKIIGNHRNRVSAWIITHPHPDHVGAFNAIMENPQGIQIDKIYTIDLDYELYKQTAQEWDDFSSYEKFLRLIKGKNNIVNIYGGEVCEILGLRFEFMYAYTDWIGMNIGDIANNGSMLFKVTGDEMSMLFCSDLGADISDILLGKWGDELQADIIQMSHHGNHGLKKDFYQAVNSNIAFFDAPNWLMEGISYDTSVQIQLMKSMGNQIYSFATAPNAIVLK